MEITAEPTVKSIIEKDNTSTQTIPDLQSANTIDILLSKIEEKIDVTINKKLAKITEVESYANAVKHLPDADLGRKLRGDLYAGLPQ